MKEFKDKVAVITGAASGIGRGIARRAAKEGMKVVVADIEKDALNQTEEELKTSGADVISVLIDVSKSEDIERLAQETLNAFGEVHLLCNNAGVGIPGPIWEATLSDWNWIMGVNLWGVIYGIRTFIPIMLQQDNECHIVNTSSMAGLMPGDERLGIYGITKHGVVALSESLRASFAQMKCKINVSVLCPGIVNTKVIDCERNRPAEFCDPDYMKRDRLLLFGPSMERYKKNHPETEQYIDMIIKMYEKGTSPDQAGDVVFKAIRNGMFYILTETGIMWKNPLKARFDGIMKAFEQNRLLLKYL